MATNMGKEPKIPAAGRDQERSDLGDRTKRNLTPSSAENNSFETGAGATGFDAPAIGSINLDNPEVDLGDDVEDADLESRSSEEELDDYDDDDDDT